MKLFLTQIFIIIMIFACSKTDKRGGPGKPQFNTDLRSTIGSHQVYCHNEDCPSAIGRIIGYTPEKKLWACTTFLISEDIVVTNRHCLPIHLQGRGYLNVNSKETPLKVLFPTVRGHHQESIDFKETVDLYPATSDSPVLNPKDVAFFRLEHPTKRIPLKISDKGAMEDQQVTIWKMDTFDNQNHILRRVWCDAKYNSVLTPQANSHNSPLIFLGHCPIYDGNSGSPVLNSDSGEVIGMLYAGPERSERNWPSKFSKNFFTNLVENKDLYDIINFSSYALVSNMACICPPLAEYKELQGCQQDLPKECRMVTDSNEYDRLVIKLLEDYLNLNPIPPFDEFVTNEKNDFFLDWKIKVRGPLSIHAKYDILIDFVPDCITDHENFVINKKPTRRLDSWAMCNLEFDLNPYLQLTGVVDYYCKAIPTDIVTSPGDDENTFGIEVSKAFLESYVTSCI